MTVTRLEYRLARKKGQQYFGCGPRYPTKAAAREAATTINRERLRAGLSPADHILALPARDADACDPSHFLSVEPVLQ